MAESYVERAGVTTSTFKRVSWAAVFAGVVITLVVQALLTLLGIGIGAASVEPLRQSDPTRGLGIGAGIWLLVSALIAVYLGAWVAGKMSGTTLRSDRTLHGLLTWGTSAIIGVLSLTSTAGALLGGTGALMGGAGAMSRNEPAYASYRLMNQAATPTTLSPTGRETGTQIQTDEQQARATADKAARRVSQAALWSFAVLVLSGLLAAYAARPKDGEFTRYVDPATRPNHAPA